jgi:hypothetical protein
MTAHFMGRFSTAPSQVGNQSWNIPLILPIGISETVKELPLLEQ